MLDRNYQTNQKYLDAKSKIHFEEIIYRNINDAFHGLNTLPDSADLRYSDVVDLGNGKYLLFTCGRS